ncbi:MAG TPA: hypothetical protein VGB18_05920 [Candidatus Thermoplasmatota archaeon]
MDPVESRRKLIHMMGGFGPVVAISLFGWLGSVSILVFVIGYVTLGGILNVRGIRLPVIAALIHGTQRNDERFPTAALEFLLAILIIGTLFHEQWFFPAIGILAFGDGAAGLIGVNWGRTKLPWSRRKSVEGVIAGVTVGILGAMLVTILGMEIHGMFWDYEPLLSRDWWASSLFIGLTFVAIVGGTHLGIRLQHKEAVANTSWVATGIVAVVCWLLAGIPYLLWGSAELPGPLVDYSLFGYNNTDVDNLLYVVIPAALVMILESFLRRHDNLILPFSFLLLNGALLWFDPLGMRPPVS